MYKGAESGAENVYKGAGSGAENVRIKNYSS